DGAADSAGEVAVVCEPLFLFWQPAITSIAITTEPSPIDVNLMTFMAAVSRSIASGSTSFGLPDEVHRLGWREYFGHPFGCAAQFVSTCGVPRATATHS